MIVTFVSSPCRHMLLLMLCSIWCASAFAQNARSGTDEFIDSAWQWAEKNLDEDVFRTIDQLNRDKVKQSLQDLQKRLHGDYVLDLAALKPLAHTILPLLEANDETRPYAAWLGSRVDYLQAADDLRRASPPLHVEPGQPPKPQPNPDVEQERKVWKKQLNQRPVPAGAAGYISKLKPIFAREGVPDELVWMAEVESGFNPSARSPAGAVGMFQLMPATAKRFGLSLSPHDQRLQPEPAAHAAARYLKVLHDRFKDWPLAIAAYNAGEGSVQKRLDRFKATTFDRIAPHLPAETQMYVPRVEATLLRRENTGLDNLH